MLEKFKKIIANQKGAIVVEATISLTAFMFFIVTILTVVNICFAQAKIGVAVNLTAKEISEYSYLYYLTGLQGKQAELYDKSSGARVTIEDTLDGVTTVFNSIDGISDTASGITVENIGSSFQGIKGNVGNINSGIKSIQSNIESIADDPKAFIISAAALGANEGIETIKSRVIAGPLSKMLCRKHLTIGDSSKEKCNEFLKHLRIEPRGGSYLDGLDFSDSVLFLNGSSEIKVIVHYRVNLIKLLDNDITLSFTQCGTTRGWVPIGSKDGKKEDPAGGSGEEKEENTEPTTEPTTPKKTAGDYVNDLIVSPNSKEAFIGVVSEKDKSDAQYYSASYITIDADMRENIKEDLGSSGVTQVYKQYVDHCLENGKTIISPSNPDNATDPYFRQQVKYLKQKGYTFRLNESTGLYIAEKSK